MNVSLNSEFLIHAADVEGLCQGIDEELVKSASSPARIRYSLTDKIPSMRIELGEWVKIPTTYAGGAKSEQSILY